MVYCCFVPGCGYALDVKKQKAIGFKNKSLFKAPKVRKQNILTLIMNNHFLFNYMLHILFRTQSF